MTLNKYFCRKDNPFDYIVLGFILRLFGTVAQNFVPYQVSDAILGTLCWILIFKGLSKIPGRLRLPFKGFYGLIIKFFLLLCFIMVVRGYLIDYNYIWFTTVGAINYHLFYPTYLICYLMPFVAWIPLRYLNFRLLINYSVIFIFITFAASIYFRDDILKNSIAASMNIALDEDSITAESVLFCGQFISMSLFSMYLPKKYWIINIIGALLCLLLCIVGARRGGVLLNSIMLVGAFYFYTKTKKGFGKFFSQAFIISAIVIGVVLLLSSTASSYLLERGLDDNRSWIEDEMLKQMSSLEQVFGKGLNGRYYCSLGRLDNYLNGWRYGIETGFFNLVLKGGYLLAFTYCLILIIPIYKGWFKSNNNFCKAASFFILYHLISLKPFGIITFDLSFFLLWIMISCCTNNEILRMTDEEIKDNFFNNN